MPTCCCVMTTRSNDETLAVSLFSMCCSGQDPVGTIHASWLDILTRHGPHCR
jgi:hypothetical protein